VYLSTLSKWSHDLLARLVLGWVTKCEQINDLGMKPASHLYQYPSEYTSPVSMIFQCKLSAAENRWWHPVGTYGSGKEFTFSQLYC